MNRTVILLVLMLARLPTAIGQQTNSELYGNFRYAYARAASGEETYWTGVNNASRLGIRGEYSEHGLTAFFDLQTGVNIDGDEIGRAFTQRYYYAGIRGAFGSVTVGRQSTAYKMAGLRRDPFYDSTSLSARGGVPGTGLYAGASYALSNLTNGFADRTVAVTSPSLQGFTGNGAVYIDRESDHDYAAGLGYNRRGVEAGLQYYHAGGGRTWSQASGIDQGLRLYAAYEQTDTWSVGASFERIETESDAGQDFVYAAATLNVTQQVVAAGGIGHVSDGVDPEAVTGTGLHLGVFFTPFPAVRLHALYSYLGAGAAPDRSNIAIGLVSQFTIQP